MKTIIFFMCLFFCIFLTACAKKTSQSDVAADSNAQSTEATSPAADAAAEAKNNDVAADETLGTKWGDDISSHVTEVDLKRKSSSPIAETQVQYANKDYKGKTVNSISVAGGKISFSVIDDNGNALPMFRVGQSYYLAGKNGQSYQLHYENNTGKTFEIVASVDGIDVINGGEASRTNSGYVLHSGDSLTIEGFRKSENAVASFTFSKPEDSYAANSANGSIQNAGVIGTVIYELEAPEDVAKPVNKYAPPPNAFPADK